MTVEPLVAHNGGIDLEGSIWLPERRPEGLLCMFPGSGPSDRDNDVLFPPIRHALLGVGVAVCSFDKRGVGGSSGSWQDAGIDVQADDLAAEVDAARDRLGGVRLGLFGHSQGGWVVLEAAAAVGPDFAITNSGPAVTPHEQEAYSTEQTLRRRGWNDAEVQVGVETFAAAMDLLALPFDVGWPRARELPLMAELVAAGVFIPSDARLWSFGARIMDHDPRPALRALDAPLLALLGADDQVVPVQRSAEVYRASVRSDLLDLRILPGGDHRLQNGDDFAPGYLDALTSFVAAQFGRP